MEGAQVTEATATAVTAAVTLTTAIVTTTEILPGGEIRVAEIPATEIMETAVTQAITATHTTTVIGIITLIPSITATEVIAVTEAIAKMSGQIAVSHPVSAIQAEAMSAAAIPEIQGPETAMETQTDQETEMLHLQIRI